MSSSLRSISGQSQQTGFLARGNRGAKTADGDRELTLICTKISDLIYCMFFFFKIFDEI